MFFIHYFENYFITMIASVCNYYAELFANGFVANPLLELFSKIQEEEKRNDRGE